MKRSFALLLALLMLLAFSLPASANDKIVDYDVDAEETFEVANCGAFTVLDNSVFHHSEELWFNNDGLLVRTRYERRGVDYLYRADRPDERLAGKFGFVGHITIESWDAQGRPATALRKFSGLWWNISIPGYGNVYHDAGTGWDRWDIINWQLISQLKVAGLVKYDNEALCAYFAD